jgi:hypothetical protein
MRTTHRKQIIVCGYFPTRVAVVVDLGDITFSLLLPSGCGHCAHSLHFYGMNVHLRKMSVLR